MINLLQLSRCQLLKFIFGVPPPLPARFRRPPGARPLPAPRRPVPPPCFPHLPPTSARPWGLATLAGAGYLGEGGRLTLGAGLP